MTSLLTIPFRIFLTITGVIAAVGLCVRVHLCMWDITAEKTGQLPVLTVCVCARLLNSNNGWQPLQKRTQWCRESTCETLGWRPSVRDAVWEQVLIRETITPPIIYQLSHFPRWAGGSTEVLMPRSRTVLNVTFMLWLKWLIFIFLHEAVGYFLCWCSIGGHTEVQNCAIWKFFRSLIKSKKNNRTLDTFEMQTPPTRISQSALSYLLCAWTDHAPTHHKWCVRIYKNYLHVTKAELRIKEVRINLSWLLFQNNNSCVGLLDSVAQSQWVYWQMSFNPKRRKRCMFGAPAECLSGTNHLLGKQLM